MLGWNCVGYVEFNEYCQKVLAQRIQDGLLDEAPIFTDVREFIQSGAADQYRGHIDVLTAGFPCQPFSVAGKRKGGGDNRNMWPETIETIRRTRPRYALLENVPGLLAHKYGRRIFADLAQAGFDARWCVLGADDVGAPHKRKRLWILAYTNSEGLERQRQVSGRTSQELSNACHPRRWKTEPDVDRVVDGLAYRMDRLKALGNGQVPAVVAKAWRILAKA